MAAWWYVALIASVVGLMAFERGTRRSNLCVVVLVGLMLDAHLRRTAAFAAGMGLDFGGHGYLAGVFVMAVTAVIMQQFGRRK